MEQNSIWKYDNAHIQVSKNMKSMDINILNVKLPVQIQENLTPANPEVCRIQPKNQNKFVHL